MKRMHLTASLFLAAVAVLILCSSTVFAAEGQFDRTLKVTGPVDLKVDTGSGSIRIVPGSGSEVAIHGRIKSSSWLFGGGSEETVRYLEKNPPIEQNGNVIRIGNITNPKYRDNVSISYEISVPAATRVVADTGSGSVQVSGLDGPVKADTGSGSVTLRNIKGKAEADTGSGSVTLSEIGGGASADTGSGSVEVLGVTGPIRANTGSGSVTIRQAGPGDISAETGSGSVEIQGADGAVTVSTGSGGVDVSGNPSRNWKIETSSGGISVRVTSPAGFYLVAENDSGSIDVQLPVTSLDHKTKHEFRGEVRGGGARMTLSSNASISVK